MLKVAVLVSGGGTNLQDIIDTKIKNVSLELVVSNNANAYALERAKNAGIKTVCIPKKNEKDVDEIAAEIKKGLEFVFVEQIEDVLNVALVK